MHAFNQTLAGIRNGALLAEAEAALSDVVKAVVATGKKGKITLTLDLAQISKGGAISVRETIKTVVPDLERGASVFFATKEGQLVKTDPTQGDLPLRAVTTVDTKPALTPIEVAAKQQEAVKING